MKSTENKLLVQLDTSELKEIISEMFAQHLMALQSTTQQEQVKVYRRKDLAEIFGVSIQTIHTWVKTDLLPKPKKIGRVCVFSYDQIKDLLPKKEK